MTIDNKSGKKYDNAKLKLIAGDVNTVKNVVYRPMPKFAMRRAKVGAAAPSFS